MIKINRALIKLSEAPYTRAGHVVQFHEGGTKWKIWKITKHSVYLENADDADGKDLDMMRKPLEEYWKSTIIYKKV